jgi:hypothetical protein
MPTEPPSLFLSSGQVRSAGRAMDRLTGQFKATHRTVHDRKESYYREGNMSRLMITPSPTGKGPGGQAASQRFTPGGVPTHWRGIVIINPKFLKKGIDFCCLYLYNIYRATDSIDSHSLFTTKARGHKELYGNETYRREEF